MPPPTSTSEASSLYSRYVSFVLPFLFEIQNKRAYPCVQADGKTLITVAVMRQAGFLKPRKAT